MNKKGFTLVELLAVIVVLAILILLAMPRVTSMMENARVNSFVVEANEIMKVAQTAYSDKVFDDESAGGTTCFTVDELITKGYLDKDPGEIRGAIVIDSSTTTSVYSYLSKQNYYIKNNTGSSKVAKTDVNKVSGYPLYNDCTTSCTATSGGASVKCSGTEITGRGVSTTNNSIYSIAFDYNISSITNPSLSTSNVMDSGYTINWDNDYRIDMIANLSQTSKRYVLIGNYAVTKHLNIEINGNNKLRVFQNTDRGISTNTVAANEDLNCTYLFNSTSKNFEMYCNGASTNASASGQIQLSGLTANTLILGKDYRDDSANPVTFFPYTLKSLKITQYVAANSTFNKIPTSVSIPGKTFDGWYTESAGGTKLTATSITMNGNKTYYAHWK